MTAAFAATLAPWRERVHLAVRYGVQEVGGLVQSRLRRPLHRLGAPGLTTLLQSPRGMVEAVPGQDWIRTRLSDFPPPLPRPMAFLVRQAPPPPVPMGLDYPGPAGTMARMPGLEGAGGAGLLLARTHGADRGHGSRPGGSAGNPRRPHGRHGDPGGGRGQRAGGKGAATPFPVGGWAAAAGLGTGGRAAAAASGQLPSPACG